MHAALLLMQQGRLSWVDANVQAAASTAGLRTAVLADVVGWLQEAVCMRCSCRCSKAGSAKRAPMCGCSMIVVCWLSAEIVWADGCLLRTCKNLGSQEPTMFVALLRAPATLALGFCCRGWSKG